MEQLLDFLHSIYPLPAKLRAHLRRIIKIRRLKKKEYLLEAGSVCKHIYFIKNGLLRCYYLKGKAEVTSWIMKEGHVVVSVNSFYDQKQSFENIHALEDTDIFYISKAELDAIYMKYMQFNFNGRELTIRYLQFWNQQLINLRLLTARERFDLLMKESPDLLLRVPQKYLASYLDMDPATFSRKKDSYGRAKRRSKASINC